MENTLTDLDKLALQKGNVITLTSSTSTASTCSGTAKMYPGYIIKAEVAISASADAILITAPFDLKIIGYKTIGKAAASTDAELELKVGHNDVVHLDADVASTINEATTLDVGYIDVSSGSTIKLKSASDDISAIAVIDILPR